MKRYKNALILVLVGVFVILGVDSIYSSGIDTMSNKDVVGDRYWCLYECKERYGLGYMFRGGGSTDVWRLYFACVTQCEKTFWKEWEKEVNEGN